VPFFLDGPDVEISFGEVENARLAIVVADEPLVGVIGEIGLARWLLWRMGRPAGTLRSLETAWYKGRVAIQTPDASPPAWLVEIDRRLVALSRSAGALRLAVGDALRTMRETGGYLELGFSSVGAYGFERVGRKPRWVDESARVAARLVELPELRAALERGRLGWSMVELLARDANPENEAQLVAEAGGMTVRAMRERLAGRSGDDEVGMTTPEDEQRTLQVSVDSVTAWAFEATRSLLRTRFAVVGDDAMVEALLAEAMSTLLTRHPELTCRLDSATRAEAWDQRRELERRLAELLAEDGLAGQADDPGLTELIAGFVDDVEAGDSPRTPVALDARLRELNTRLQTRDRRIGELASEVWGCSGWRELGYASAAQYANERLGCSLASVKARMTLARRCKRLVPEVALALDDGDIGYEAARLVARVADRETVYAWLDRAASRTTKHLREEVEIVEAVARAEGVTSVGCEPPDAALVSEFQDLERRMLDGTVAELVVNGGRLEGSGSSQISVTAGDAESQISVTDDGRGRWAGLVPLRMRLRSETVGFWRDIARLFEASGEAGSFVDFLIRAFWSVWLRRDPERVAYQDVYERARLRCESPVCSNRDLTPHHLKFRGHGGGDERSNLAGLCVTCHLEVLHLGRMRAVPPAHDIHWTLGRDGFLEVHGRELLG